VVHKMSSKIKMENNIMGKIFLDKYSYLHYYEQFTACLLNMAVCRERIQLRLESASSCSFKWTAKLLSTIEQLKNLCHIIFSYRRHFKLMLS
jgi:hypothetical protein